MDEEAERAAELRGRSRAREGQTLDDKWTLERLIGQGGTAAVYAARHRNGRALAVKILHTHLAQAPAMARRFLREAQAANRVGHPGTVAILDDGTLPSGEPFLVLELLEGEALDARLAREGTLAASEARGIAARVLAVLEAAHRSGVVHRDVKPANVFVCRSGEVKLLDFGIASLDDGAEGSLATRQGSTRGTPAYMAPEQARGERERIGPATDVWAVGALLFRMLTGRHVHQGDTATQVMFVAGTQPAPPLSTHAPDAPSSLAAAVDRSLSFRVEDRFASARAFLDALEHRADAPAARAPVAERTEPESLPIVPATTGEETAPEARSFAPRVEPKARWLPVVAAVSVLALGTLGWRALARDASSSPSAPALTLGASASPVASTIASVASVASVAGPAAAQASSPPPPSSTTQASAPPSRPRAPGAASARGAAAEPARDMLDRRR